MGVSLSTARYLAPASFLYDFAAQQYGMLSTPNMKTIHDAHLSFFSPQPYMIAGFFFPQQIAQLAWLWKLWKAGADRDAKQTGDDEQDIRQMVDYVPIYVLGNVCIGTWMFFWNASDLRTSNIFVWVNTVSQLAYIATRLRPLSTSPSALSLLNHVIVKTFAGIGVLDVLHNTSVAYFDHAGAPSALGQFLTGAGFAAASAASDWILGACLVYDLVALSVGQMGRGEADWGRLLGLFAAGAAGIVGLRNWFFPKYEKRQSGYKRAPLDDENDDEISGRV